MCLSSASRMALPHYCPRGLFRCWRRSAWTPRAYALQRGSCQATHWRRSRCAARGVDRPLHRSAGDLCGLRHSGQSCPARPRQSGAAQSGSTRQPERRGQRARRARPRAQRWPQRRPRPWQALSISWQHWRAQPWPRPGPGLMQSTAPRATILFIAQFSCFSCYIPLLWRWYEKLVRNENSPSPHFFSGGPDARNQ